MSSEGEGLFFGAFVYLVEVYLKSTDTHVAFGYWKEENGRPNVCWDVVN